MSAMGISFGIEALARYRYLSDSFASVSDWMIRKKRKPPGSGESEVPTNG
jgi:hypothetical protein